MVRCRVSGSSFALLRCAHRAGRLVRPGCLAVLSIALWQVADQPALSQNLSHAHDLLALDVTPDSVFAMPQAAPAKLVAPQGEVKNRPESEIVFQGAGSFGHYHLLGNSWWSDLYWSSIEYDRHSWGNFIGAQMDYVAEFQPIVILRQPPKTNVWGIPLTTARVLVPGIGFAPIGLRMMWRSDKSIKPFCIFKGGMVGYTQKALSQEASYVNLSLQVGIGMQFHLRDRLDMRVGLTDYHFSDAFIVPSNPGLDVMAYTGGLSYHLGKHAR